LPPRPHIPLQSNEVETRELLKLLDANQLSPSSHQIGIEGHQDSTRPVDRADAEADLEYRRVARMALSVQICGSFVTEQLRLAASAITPEEKEKSLLLAQAAHELSALDREGITDYLCTRVAHHRRHMIRKSTEGMPQMDIQQAIRRLPLSTSDSLIHESAATVIAQTLQHPEGRQLKPIPNFRKIRHDFYKGKSQPQHENVTDSFRPRPNVRKQTHNAFPKAGAAKTFLRKTGNSAPFRTKTRPKIPPAPFKYRNTGRKFGSNAKQLASGSRCDATVGSKSSGGVTTKP